LTRWRTIRVAAIGPSPSPAAYLAAYYLEIKIHEIKAMSRGTARNAPFGAVVD
jgi:hypothetical protein